MTAWQKKSNIALVVTAGLLLLSQAGDAQAPAAAQAEASVSDSPHDLIVGVGKTVIVTTELPVERVSVGYGDFAEAEPTSPREVLVNGKAPGETSLIIWQVNGPKLFFDLSVRPSGSVNTSRLDALRRQLRTELPGQNLTPSIDNDTIFLRGTVKDTTSADRAVAIAGSFGKTVNLLYVDVPPTQTQVLLRVKFASIDHSVSSQLGLNLVSTGATNTQGTVTTQQFSPPSLTPGLGGAAPALTLSNALNIFLFRPDLNLAATIQALEQKNLIEVLAEPDVLAYNGKQASFLAGGEFPFPVVQGGTGTTGTAITVQFREYGVRLNFVPNVTPRGTILLDVAPEVSALDFANGLTIQGFTIPGITSRKVRTEVELRPGQSFAIAGLLDRQLQETLEKIPILGDIPVLGKLFQSRNLTRQNTELLVIVTPELVQPIPAGQAIPDLKFPKELMKEDSPGQTKLPGQTSTAPPPAAVETVPLEKLLESMHPVELNMQSSGGQSMSGGSLSSATGTSSSTTTAPK